MGKSGWRGSAVRVPRLRRSSSSLDIRALPGWPGLASPGPRFDGTLMVCPKVTPPTHGNKARHSPSISEPFRAFDNPVDRCLHAPGPAPGQTNWRTLTARRPWVLVPLDEFSRTLRTRFRRHLRGGSQVSKARPGAPIFLSRRLSHRPFRARLRFSHRPSGPQLECRFVVRSQK